MVGKLHPLPDDLQHLLLKKGFDFAWIGFELCHHVGTRSKRIITTTPDALFKITHLPLGFITRTDLRQVENAVSYFFRRSSGPLLAVIPSVSSSANWNYARRLEDASIDMPLWFDFKGPASAAVTTCFGGKPGGS